MKIIKSGLSRKITVLCLLLATVICGALCTIGYIQYRSSTYQTYNSFAYDIANTALAYVDGDHVTDYLVTGKTDAAYDEMAWQIYTLYKHTELTSIYICVPNENDLTVTTIYDVRVHEAENPSLYALGVVDPIGAENPQEVVDIYLTGELSSNYFVRTTQFGYNTSAIVPVRSSTGQVTALLLADVPMPYIIRNLNTYLLITISVTAVLVFVLMLLYLAYLRRRVVTPIRLITENAAAFARGHKGFSKDIKKLKTGDEIETLADALAKMEVDINDYMKSLAKVTADKQRIATELAVATQIQTSMLPCIFPAFPERKEFDIYAVMHAAKEVGGDFYDYFLIDDSHLGVVIADVSGKGVPAALFMVIAKTLIKNHAQAGMTPEKIFETVNGQLCENNEAGMFVTAFMGILEIHTGRFTYVNAGHNPPLVSLGGKPFDWMPSKRCFVLAGMENMQYKQQEITLSPGDSLFLYTDGVTEALDMDENLYSDARLLELFRSGKLEGKNIKERVDIVRQDIAAFSNGAEQADDITMLLMEIGRRGE